MIDLIYATEIELELELDAETDYQNELTYQIDDMAAFIEYSEECRNTIAWAWQEDCNCRNLSYYSPRRGLGKIYKIEGRRYVEGRRTQYQATEQEDWDHEYFMSLKPADHTTHVEYSNLPF